MPIHTIIVDGLLEEILIKRISDRINRARIHLLRNHCGKDRSQPYKHESLLDLEIDEHNLVDLGQFQTDKRILERNGYVFEITPTLSASNSSYWLKENLLNLSDNVSKSIRLDPLSIQSKSEYRSAFYKMWVYGVSLDWEQISSLKEDVHGRWMPDDLLGTGSTFTDVLWSPRGDEVHFLCEEMPLREEIQNRGSRYFHSIYLPKKKHFIHVDGAIRYYSKNEFELRFEHHVRNAGKIGQRVKIFKVDGTVSLEDWGGLASSFFVWNRDVTDYLSIGSDIPRI